MKQPVSFFLLLFCLTACIPEKNYEKQPNPEAIVKDFNTWWAYNSAKINFARDYSTFGRDLKPISKEAFFYQLMSGNYIAVKLLSKDTLEQHYQLFQLNSKGIPEIGEQSAQFGEREYQKYKLEGLQLPDFNFKDLNGTVYNKESTKGKIIVLNVWFIGCIPCVAEMPALNDIRKKYKNRPNILFLALTFDNADSVKAFLMKKEFAYTVLPGQDVYIKEKLGIRSYPTQIIVSNEGKIVRVFDNYDDINYWLDKEEISN